ncbi:hypothetical protein [Streptomyces sp. 2A115]|uniref:hypothetical protein n=1 Tax=Streptomyces sp. 2A115 TaxID=3457439 RepID=UPI003FCF90EC
MAELPARVLFGAASTASTTGAGSPSVSPPRGADPPARTTARAPWAAELELGARDMRMFVTGRAGGPTDGDLA